MPAVADRFRAGSVYGAPASAEAPVLQAVELVKHFEAGGRRWRSKQVVHAVEGVSVALHRGKVTAVVGESGSGKSTLAWMLARLIAPSSGRLLLEGHEVPVIRSSARRSKSTDEYRRAVQLVLQDPFASMNPVHTVSYVLQRPLKLHGIAGRGPELDAALARLLERVKLTPAEQYLPKLPHELSGGQRQRVSIARALAVSPRVLLADEPVSMLDVSIRLGVLNLLGELRDEEGLAILYVTHDIASARYFADMVMVMYAGEVVEVGPSMAITDHPSHPYTRLLLSAAPDPERVAVPVIEAAGTPPSLIDPPGGCRFHPRCPHAMPICAQERPPEVSTGEGQAARCWLHVPAGDRRAQSVGRP